jgi:hypothetical protein
LNLSLPSAHPVDREADAGFFQPVLQLPAIRGYLQSDPSRQRLRNHLHIHDTAGLARYAIAYNIIEIVRVKIP